MVLEGGQQNAELVESNPLLWQSPVLVVSRFDVVDAFVNGVIYDTQGAHQSGCGAAQIVRRPAAPSQLQ